MTVAGAGMRACSGLIIPPSIPEMCTETAREHPPGDRGRKKWLLGERTVLVRATGKKEGGGEMLSMQAPVTDQVGGPPQCLGQKSCHP